MIRTALSIAARDVRSAFVTPIAYVVIAGFMLLAGFFFFTILQEFTPMAAQANMLRDVIPNLNEWVVTPYYNVLEVVLIFLVPLLTMRSIAEEHRDENGEINHTSLAEAIAAQFNENDEGGPLDDPDHWIWEVALEVE